MGKKKVLLVDFNNVLYRSVFSHSGLSHKRQFTGGIYGAIDMICRAVNRYAIDRIAICYDTKPYFRSEYFPAYKSDRRKELSEAETMKIATSKKAMREWFQMFRFPQAFAKGYEADDFIGHFARTCRNRYSQIFIFSNDSDFYQLLRPRVFLCAKGGLFGLKDFREKFPGLRPKDWPRCLALMGSHNGVPGIKGVGEKTAYKHVATGISDREIFEKWGVRRSEIQKREKLATFPFPRVGDPPMSRIEAIDYDAYEFEIMLDSFGIKFRDEYHEAMKRLAA